MSSDLNHSELFNQYLSGKLSMAERERFEQELSANTNLKQEYDDFELTQKAVLRHELFAFKNEIADFQHKKQKQNRFKKIALTASGVLFISAAAAIFLNTGSEKENIQFIEKDSIEVVENQSSDRNPEIKNLPSEKKESPVALDKQQKESSVAPDTLSEKEAKPSSVDTISKEKTPTVKEAVNAKTSNICTDVSLTASLESSSSCAGAKEGTIQLLESTIKGGKAPYMYSLEGENYTSNATFSNLAPGEYVVWIKDQNNCQSPVGLAEVESKNCLSKKEYIIDPSSGVYWQPNLPSDFTGVVSIYDISNAKVITFSVNDGINTVWKGENTTGNLVENGIYTFTIESQGKIFEQGMIRVR